MNNNHELHSKDNTSVCKKKIKLLKNNIENTIECFKKLILIIKKINAFDNNYFLTIDQFNDLDLIVEENQIRIYEKICQLNDILTDYIRINKSSLTTARKRSSHDSIDINQEKDLIQIHPELFFSQNKIKNINIIKLISQGKIAKVFLISLKSSNDKTYAMKTIKKYDYGDMFASLEFERYKITERDIGKLGNECSFLVETFAAFRSKGYLFQIMEFMNAGNLAFHLKKLKKFSEEQVKFYAAQIVCGLVFLHEKGFIHCDLKLENVLMQSNGYCKISGFSSSINFSQMNNGIFWLQKYPTFEYRAPENSVDYAIDFWALGILMYRMLSGLFPFSNMTEIENKELNNFEELGVSKATEIFIMKLLTKDKKKRLGSKQNNKIKEDTFFQEIDFVKLENMEIKAPYIPDMLTDTLNVKQNNSNKNKNQNKNLFYITADNVEFFLDKHFETLNEQVFANIKITKLIYVGTFGNVYAVKSSDKHNQFALKTVRKQFRHTLVESDDYIFCQFVLNEKEIGSLAHRSRFLVKLIASFQNRNYIFFFMEYMSGSLGWYLRKLIQFSENKTRFYSAQILCGIQFLHANQIIHRDIKLENVLLDSEGNAKICDFGSCQKFGLDDGLYDGKDCGTVEYLAPELGCSYEIDFWALGVVIFKLLTSEFPFNALKNAVNDQIPNLNEIRLLKNKKYEISENTINIVSKLLTKNPKQRLGSEALAENIRDDPFFRSINWTQLEKGEIKPPIQPKQKSKIDTDFLNEKINLKHLGAQYKKLNEYRFKHEYKNFDYNLEFIRNNS